MFQKNYVYEYIDLFKEHNFIRVKKNQLMYSIAHLFSEDPNFY